MEDKDDTTPSIFTYEEAENTSGRKTEVKPGQTNEEAEAGLVIGNWKQ